MAAFEELGLIPEIGKALDEKEWLLPTDVQAEAIPLILGGGDVLMAAETGSGKTGAFCLPIVQIVWETLKDLQSNPGGSSKVKSASSGNKLLLSFFDRGNAMAITPDGLKCQSREMKEWHGCRATKGVCGGGKYYFETKVEDEGLCRVGWSTQGASLDLGTDKQGYGYGGTGKKSNNRQFDDYGEPFGLHDVIGCLLDLDSKSISFTKNGKHLGEAFRLNDHIIKCGLFPAVVLKNAEILFNFGDSAFKHQPSGYVKITDAQPKYTVKNSVSSGGGPASSSGNVKTAPQAIIIEPSRELAEQTYNAIQSFKKYVTHPIPKEVLVIGGCAVKDQIAEIQNGVDIIVGTPGRLEDFIGQGILSLTQCRFFVLDEADGLLQQGHQRLITDMHKNIPKITSDGRRLQMIVCSATLHSFEVKKLAEQLMHFPTWVDLKGQDSVPETVHHVVLSVDPQRDKSWQSLRKHIQTDGVHAKDDLRPGTQSPEVLSEAIKLLKGEYCIKAINKLKMDQAIIFCRTKLDCDNLERYFQQVGGGPRNPQSPYSCVCLHGDRKPQERSGNLEKFKKNQVRFLICTDVAARGIDIGGLPFMINMTLPDEKSNYVHRIGRVGRAERMGLAISFKATVPEKVWYHGKYCASHGKNCWNTELLDNHGCCVWYNENQYLADIEEHLGVTVSEIGLDLDIPVDDFDGKVVYGSKKANSGSNYQTHVEIMAPTVKDLANLERQAQIIYLHHYIASEANKR